METNTEKIADKLNALVQKNSDAQKGFERAGQIVTSKTLSDWFVTRAVERRIFREELKEEVHSFGHPCVQTPSLTGDIHRAWMDIKAAFSADSDKAMLKEAVRGEKAALDEYNEVFAETTMPPSTDVLLKAHRAKIEDGLAILRAMENIEFQEES